jgi:hypothetical protein
MILEKDFTDFIELLNLHRVDYLVVGGYALAFHGEPRTTGDLDIWIDCSSTNADKMVKVMNDFGMASLGFTSKDFAEPGIINQIGQPPLRIDILTEIDGVLFLNATKKKEYFKTDKLLIPFISKEDLIRNKTATGRKKDLADVKKLLPKAVKKSKGKGKEGGLNK